MSTQVRQLPQDVTAEAAVLAAMLIDNYSISVAIEMLSEKHFYKSSHKLIYRGILKLFEENIEIDVITLLDWLKRHDLLEKAGGVLYINEVSDTVLSGANLKYHAKIVLEKALLRDMITTANSIIEDCYLGKGEVDSIVDRAEQAMFEIAERPDSQGFMSASLSMPEVLNTIEEVSRTKTQVHGIGTGFTKLDSFTGGFKPGQFIVIAARPAMGKTSFALNIASHATVSMGKKVGVFTMEMASEELLIRMLSSGSRVPMDNILKGYGMNQEKMANISLVAQAIAESKLYIDDTGANTALDIRAKSRRLKAELKGLDMIMIDYLQLMSGTSKENRQQEIADISRSLKILARELEIPVIALSQLNRGLEARPNKRPLLSDLRESGAIEQDADVVIFIYRDEVYHYSKNDKEKNDEAYDQDGVAEIIIGKNRHGAVGTVKLRFVKELTKFENDESLNQDSF